MPETKEEKCDQKTKFLVVNCDGVDRIFDNMEKAREYIQDEYDADDLGDVRVFRFLTEYKINSNKNILFSKV